MRYLKLFVAVLTSVILISIVWEFGIEDILPHRFFGGVQYPESNQEKWELVIVSAVFSAIALTFPLFLLRRGDKKRKKAEELTSRFGRIMESSSNEIYIFSGETLRFTQVNKGARENLGYTIGELVKFTPLDIKPEYTKEAFLKLVEPLRRGEVSKLTFQTVHKRKDGSLYPIDPSFAKPCFKRHKVLL